jgi:hypothetical protein
MKTQFAQSDSINLKLILEAKINQKFKFRTSEFENKSTVENQSAVDALIDEFLFSDANNAFLENWNSA